MGAEAIASIVQTASAEAINLDAAANAPPTPSVIRAIGQALDSGAANPSSGHFLGDKARLILETTRDEIAAMVSGLTENGVMFTSGCTEANNMVLKSAASVPGITVIVSATEHPSVLRPAEWLARVGVRMEVLRVDGHGIVDLDQLQGLISGIAGPILLSIQIANSETGVLQPIDLVTELLADRPNILFHADAAQALGKLPLWVGDTSGPHVLTASAHKMHGPMGLGAVLTGDALPFPLDPLLLGGEQEGGYRAGTQSVPLIAGWGAAILEWQSEGPFIIERLRLLRDRFEATLVEAVPDARLNGGSAARLPNIANFIFPGVDGMALVAQLDAAGIAVSQGSACSSRRPEPSHVLTEMGLSEADAFSSVRFSFSRFNTEAEANHAAAMIADRIAYLRSRS